MFGMYKALQGQFHGALTGKGMAVGGSAIRMEATGYGLVYFVEAMLARLEDRLEGKRVAISGKGNVARYAAEKAIAEGAIVVTLSDTSGTLHTPDGFTQEAVDWVRDRKIAGEAIAEPPAHLGLRFAEGAAPWGLETAQIALPCATENEMDAAAVQAACDAGLRLLAEGANMPLTAEATRRVRDAGIPRAPGKASNAGGVAVSGLEISQNRYGQFTDREEVDRRLRAVMAAIHGRVCRENGDGPIDYHRCADVAAYRTLAEAIVTHGTV
jgi:glutamate dehydrogenase (NADP+)